MYLSRSLILALDEGRSYSRIEVEPNTSRPKISRWKVRFEKSRMAGPKGRHKGSKPGTVTAAGQGKVLRKTTQKPDDRSTHWSCRGMASALGLSKSTAVNPATPNLSCS
jgi:hypothetical protein